MIHWAKTQANVALSSGEAELNSCVKGLVEGVGLFNLYNELFEERLPFRISVDASACKGMLLRTGAGKIKHISTKQLWAQGAIASFGIEVQKIPRSINAADLLTHLVTAPTGVDQLRRIGFVFL